MRAFLIAFIALFLRPAAAADVHFNPVTTINARTIQRGTLAFGRAPLGNINSTFLANSLNFGLFSRVEVGTAPIFYTSPEHQINYVVKLNFWRGDWVDWTYVFGQNIFRTKIEKTNGDPERTRLEMTANQLALNFHPPGSKASLGVSGTQSCAHVDSDDGFVRLGTFRCVGEVGLDLQYEVLDERWLTLGYGRMRDTGITPYEELSTGVGAAFTWTRPEKLFSMPSLGLYRTFTGNTLLLVSTTFY